MHILSIEIYSVSFRIYCTQQFIMFLVLILLQNYTKITIHLIFMETKEGFICSIIEFVAGYQLLINFFYAFTFYKTTTVYSFERDLHKL
jgi:hypothetical protein